MFYLTNVNNFSGPAGAYLWAFDLKGDLLVDTFQAVQQLGHACATDLRNFSNQEFCGFISKSFMFQPPGNPGEAYIRRQLGMPEVLD